MTEPIIITQEEPFDVQMPRFELVPKESRTTNLTMQAKDLLKAEFIDPKDQAEGLAVDLRAQRR